MFLFGERREVVYQDDIDSGGMFSDTVGVILEDGRYRAFVTNGWGGGFLSGKKFDSLAEAQRDIERLVEKL